MKCFGSIYNVADHPCEKIYGFFISPIIKQWAVVTNSIQTFYILLIIISHGPYNYKLFREKIVTTSVCLFNHIQQFFISNLRTSFPTKLSMLANFRARKLFISTQILN